MKIITTTQRPPQKPRARNGDEPFFLVPPPQTFTVDHEYRPVLYRADGTPLVRKAGFK